MKRLLKTVFIKLFIKTFVVEWGKISGSNFPTVIVKFCGFKIREMGWNPLSNSWISPIKPT